MGQVWKGVELVNCSPPSTRRGPCEVLPQGKYQGMRVDDIIRRDPRYFMWAVKEWLNVSPKQAILFTLLTDGEIPLKYISEDTPRDKRGGLPPPDKETYVREIELVPNWDFDPESAPSWWQTYKEKSRGKVSLSEKVKVYQDVVREEFRKLRDSL